MKNALVNFALRAPGSLRSRIRIFALRHFGMQIGARCWLRNISVPRNPWDIQLGDDVALDDGVILLSTGEPRNRPRLRIGARVYVNRLTMFDVSHDIEIGADSMIGPFVYITDHDHGRDLSCRIANQPLVAAPVVVGENVWIGAGAIVLKGVTIGRNAIIGAGAVVVRDVAEGVVVGGNPAQALLLRSGTTRNP